MSYTALPVAVLAGITLHAGAFHLLLYLRSGERFRADLYFGITAMMIALYDLCCVGLYQSTSLAQGMFWQRLQMVWIASAGLSFLYFVEAYAEISGPRFVRRLGWLFPITGLYMLVERRGLLLTGVPAIKHFTMPFAGAVTYYESNVGPVYNVLSCGMLGVTAYVLWLAWRVWRAGDLTRARLIVSAIAVFSIGAFNDSLIATGLLSSLYLVEYTWTAIVVLAGYALSKELMSAALSKQALAESKVRLAHAERLESVGKLAGGVAHDLNNMLTPVIGYAQLAQDLMTPGSRERSYLDHLVGAAERAAALTQQLLAFARKQVLEVRPLDLAESLEQLEPLLRRLLPENIALAIHSDPQIPLVEADRAQLEQVWMNLASNARDAMPQGGRLSFEVVRDVREGVPGVLVCVSDTGAGMSSSVLDRAFDPFFSTKARGQGTGLGLSIVHGIVEQHGGRISVQSQLGHGTTFRLFFPITDKRAEPSQRPALANGQALQGNARILVVDDDRAVLQLVIEVLKRFGYDVESASSLPELSQLLGRPQLKPLDLLISDVVLPDMDGNQVKSLVSARFPGIGCVFMTGHADEVLAPRGILRDRVELLRKPFAADELLHKVRSVLELLRTRASQPPRGVERPSPPPAGQ